MVADTREFINNLPRPYLACSTTFTLSEAVARKLQQILYKPMTWQFHELNAPLPNNSSMANHPHHSQSPPLSLEKGEPYSEDSNR